MVGQIHRECPGCGKVIIAKFLEKECSQQWMYLHACGVFSDESKPRDRANQFESILTEDRANQVVIEFRSNRESREHEFLVLVQRAKDFIGDEVVNRGVYRVIR